MRNIPLEERPRERLLSEGPEALANRDLLAILLTSALKEKNVLALSDELLQTFGGLEGLSEASFFELTAIKGMGRAKALQLLSAMNLAKRLLREKAKKACVITDSREAFEQTRDLFFGAKQEKLVLLLLSSKLSLIHREIITVGTLTEVPLHPREVFRSAIRYSAHSVVLAHNHPGGEVEPSNADIDLTEKLRKAGLLLGIPVLDHIIVAEDRYYSLMNR